MSSPVPKKHHYVPQSILKRFSIEGKERQVYVFDKATCRSYPAAIKDAGAENHFYSVEIGDQRHILEHLFQDIDDKGADLLDRVCQLRSLQTLSSEDRILLCAATAVQLLRVKKMRSDLIDLSQQLASLLEKYGGGPVEDGEMSENQARLISIDTLAELPFFAQHFIDKDIALISSGESRFIISDNPVVLNNSFPYGDLGLSSPGVEIYFPVSCNLTLGFFCRSVRKGYLEPFESRGEKRHQALLDAFRSGAPIEFAAEKVDFLNYLQIHRSSQYLFSSESDFSYAILILDQNPALAHERPSIQVGWEGYVYRERMPNGSFLVAVGQESHYMIPVEFVDEEFEDCEWVFWSPIPEMVLDAMRDSPFKEVTRFVDKAMKGQTRDVIFLDKGNGMFGVRMRDEGLHKLFLHLDQERKGSIPELAKKAQRID